MREIWTEGRELETSVRSCEIVQTPRGSRRHHQAVVESAGRAGGPWARRAQAVQLMRTQCAMR